MSATLLADLDAYYGGSISKPQEVAQPPDEEDDFGDFEGPEPTQPAARQPAQAAIRATHGAPHGAPHGTSHRAPEYDAWADMQWSSSGQKHDSRMNTNVTSTNPTALLKRVTPENFTPDVPKHVLKNQHRTRDENVLFDAEEDDEEEEADDYAYRGSGNSSTAPLPRPTQESVVLKPIDERTIWVPEKRSPLPNLLDIDDEFATAQDSSSARHAYGPAIAATPGAHPSRTAPVAQVDPLWENGLSFEAPQGGIRHEAQSRVQTFERPPDPTLSSGEGDDFDAWDDFEVAESHKTPDDQHDSSFVRSSDNSAAARNAVPARRVVAEKKDPTARTDTATKKDAAARTDVAARRIVAARKDVAARENVAARETESQAEPLTGIARLLTRSIPADAVPPTNIPPPSVLFTLFPPIFKRAQADLSHVLAKDAMAERDESNVQYIHDYISVATTCARVISGRKLRWKRDAILAQSMRIGPASASGKSGGMKLAGIDKGENVREEREAADVVALWKRQYGRLRTAFASIKGIAHVPELSETMPVRIASSAEGALTSPKPCTLCGLKRNERINKIDANVQDSFGEWWVEHWGHFGCISFWENYKSELIGR